ncbi:MAG: hypothetical protein KIT69_14285, partial [Propionibacteriaceae bacterium]|nr:hypothetical protein [Propionibacteriaceae bacterium]
IFYIKLKNHCFNDNISIKLCDKYIINYIIPKLNSNSIFINYFKKYIFELEQLKEKKLKEKQRKKELKQIQLNSIINIVSLNTINNDLINNSLNNQLNNEVNNEVNDQVNNQVNNKVNNTGDKLFLNINITELIQHINENNIDLILLYFKQIDINNYKLHNEYILFILINQYYITYRLKKDNQLNLYKQLIDYCINVMNLQTINYCNTNGTNYISIICYYICAYDAVNHNNNIYIMQQLINKGIDINKMNDNKQTAISRFSSSNKYKYKKIYIQFLIDNGAEICIDNVDLLNGCNEAIHTQITNYYNLKKNIKTEKELTNNISFENNKKVKIITDTGEVQFLNIKSIEY